MSKPRALLPLLLLGFSFTAVAQVYQSTDSEGNVTFSDSPTAGSQEIEVPETNVGDAVKVPEFKPEPESEPSPTPKVVVEEAAPEEAVEGNYEGGGSAYRRRHHKRYGHGR